MYKLPLCGEEKEYDASLRWERAYRACDELHGASGPGQKFAAAQLLDPESELSQLGIGICRELSEKAKKPFHYYLRTVGPGLIRICEPFGGEDSEKASAPRERA